MSDGLLDALGGAPNADSQHIYGVVVAIVTNNDDPDGSGRVKVRFPWLSDSDESWWARLAVPMAGADRGFLFLPEVDDEVLVAFEHGDPRFPYVVGSLWNGQDKPPEPQALDGGKVVRRVLKSRAGHLVRLDDTEGGEKIEIVDKTGQNSVTLDSSTNTITLRADGDVVLESSSGNVVIKGQGVEISSSATDVKIESTANLEMTAQAQSTLKGAMVNIN
jgi:uncharacterized protein involved in type VI secretion and phage assembly